jgi:membrane-associated phospholipid phosphatase
VLRIAACAFGAGLAVHLGKFSVIRWRPHRLSVDSVWDSFCGWFPLLNGYPDGVRGASDIQSFPSGHTATAVGLAIALAYYYPQGRWLFACFATLAATQRIASGAHYLSDTLAGAALACLVSALCFDPRVLGKSFDRFERGDTSQNGKGQDTL